MYLFALLAVKDVSKAETTSQLTLASGVSQELDPDASASPRDDICTVRPFVPDRRPGQLRTDDLYHHAKTKTIRWSGNTAQLRLESFPWTPNEQRHLRDWLTQQIIIDIPSETPHE
jgi:hypothetical protein